MREVLATGYPGAGAEAIGMLMAGTVAIGALLLAVAMGAFIVAIVTSRTGRRRIGEAC